jgi:lysozyme family protein
MADFDQAFAYLMKFEDEGLSGRVTKDAGGRTRFGIAERYHPELTHSGFYDDMSKYEALLLAKETYQQHEWHAMQGDKISSQELANKMLSLGVDIGIVAVIRWAQEAAHVDVDGQVGPATLAAWNKATGATGTGAVFHAISMDAEAHYRQRAQDDAADRKYLGGWLKRAQDAATEVAKV